MNSIAPYEATHGKGFERPDIFEPGKTRTCSAREKLAYLIDDSWFHSNYWPSDNHNEFLDKAKRDLNTELLRASSRIAELEEARQILLRIDREPEA